VWLVHNAHTVDIVEIRKLYNENHPPPMISPNVTHNGWHNDCHYCTSVNEIMGRSKDLDGGYLRFSGVARAVIGWRAGDYSASLRNKGAYIAPSPYEPTKVLIKV
jgi:hypothetical protein